ncbi:MULTISPECIES: DUF2933 domain-containing protein [Lactococcus]|uniref:DUF2933 domain-containing protein n=2 Tax=Lactococcus TaxID=1357 RepID=T0THI8_LACLC|nr:MULTISPECIES: DUF2933 domain-containing protein [Lactococcus]EQC57054.1 hypothetical protein LLT6_12475 [Lactococcus cremoris subsp. cremoris TIFN6]MBN2958072.1 DUF2933 domain-containing protein [Streptococcus gordonii]KAF6606001.1 DUF2933 domain-containing protein [Lactococcus sp. EKM201L]KAF6610869.1 DUF2933 domain-containing protein [Lactococcus sp. EKM203L]KAF6639915.1 DUF2933 domain-containing protein [Lactococcus sp. EKM501L]
MPQFITSIIPYAFILICPLMMLFMMKGMHGKHSESSSNHEANEFHQAEIEELKSQNEKMSRELEDLKRHIY